MTSNTNTPAFKKHRIILCVLAVLLLWASLGLRFGEHAQRTSAAATTVSNSSFDAMPSLALALAPAPATGIARKRKPPEGKGPVIDSITVEKKSACYGEQNFARVSAHVAGIGGSERLAVRIAGTREMGFRLPFRIERGGEGEYPEVIVAGGGGPAVIQAIPQVQMLDCDVHERAAIDVSLEPRSPHLLTLTARIDGLTEDSSFTPVAYEWDFGDGTKATTETAEIEHSYEGALPRTRYAHFLLQVRVRGADGELAEGARAYGIPNLAFGALADEGRVALSVAGGSLPGEHSARGERFRLYHSYEHPARLTQVVVREVSRTNEGERELSRTEHAPRELLGIDELPAGGAVETLDLVALRPNDAANARIIELTGEADGMPVSGRIVLAPVEANGGEELPEVGAELGNAAPAAGG